MKVGFIAVNWEDHFYHQVKFTNYLFNNDFSPNYAPCDPKLHWSNTLRAVNN